MEKQSSQSQQETGSGRAWKGAGLGFGKLGEENMARMESLFEGVAELERKGVEEAHRSIDEAARMTKELVTYAVRLTSGWRTVAAETTRQTVETFTKSFTA